MSASISDLETTLTLLEDNFHDAYIAAPDDTSRLQLRLTLAAARDAYWKAVADGMKDKNEFVQLLSDELKTENDNLSAALGNLQNFAAFLDTAKEAVKLAAAIAALAAAQGTPLHGPSRTARATRLPP